MTGPVRMHVGDAVVARVAARHARQVPGVVALRADLAQALLGVAGVVLGQDRSWLPADGVTAAVHGDSAEVRVTIVSRLGHNCRDLARAVQREVATGVRDYTGLDALVTVTIADVLLD
ncbi:Asp23/Gls24 family envelope stress response protein [Pseudonocardia sp. MH-G8]|uniref:Asp23/Gls24 family envelope stress response protein n=1 Tax=Pseudonocardia sp. MH-G8 TaxID=1854588 RepID=UPI001E4F2C1F|nr:Asp23/Gls24 family envelope stress response protein [Pseudonocardia sp. MH-G8]